MLCVATCVWYLFDSSILAAGRTNHTLWCIYNRQSELLIGYNCEYIVFAVYDIPTRASWPMLFLKAVILLSAASSYVINIATIIMTYTKASQLCSV